MCQFPGLANRNRYITVSRIRDCSNAYRESLGCVRLEVEAVVGAGEGAGHGRPTSSLSPGLLVLRVLDETLGPVSLGYHQLPCRRERVGGGDRLLQEQLTWQLRNRVCSHYPTTGKCCDRQICSRTILLTPIHYLLVVPERMRKSWAAPIGGARPAERSISKTQRSGFACSDGREKTS